jgi:hypothetical protein
MIPSAMAFLTTEYIPGVACGYLLELYEDTAHRDAHHISSSLETQLSDGWLQGDASKHTDIEVPAHQVADHRE